MLVQHIFLNSTSTLIQPTFNSTQKKPPVRIPKFSERHVSTGSLKRICERGSLQEAFVSLGDIFVSQKSPENCFDEAYSLVLELCASRESLSEGEQIHAHVLKCNAVYDSLFLNTKLVFFYGKCGSILDAQKVFDGMCERTTFTWNAMLGSYVSKGEHFRALELFEEMCLFGVPLDARTFPCVLKACGGLKDLCSGTKIHGLAIKQGLISNVFVANALLALYAKCDDLNRALLLFKRIKEGKDIVSWNSIISAYATNEQSTNALSLLREMQQLAVAPSTYTFVSALQACEEASLGIFGREIHAVVLKSGHYLDIHVANALVVMYSKCGKMDEAAIIFGELSEKDNISWNSMLSGFVWNGLYHEALQFFQKMPTSGGKSDQCLVLSLLAIAGRLENLLNGMEIHALTIKNGLEFDLQIGNTIMDMYAKCGRLNYMDSVLKRMPFRDLISWSTVIAGCAQNSCYLRAVKLFREVVGQGMDIDAVMIGSLLVACSGLKCISLAKEVHGYILRRGLSDRVLQNSIIDGYGECGNIDYAFHVFQMIENKNVVSWTSMITCYVHNGLANAALELFLSMTETGLEPDSVALVSALSAVADLSFLRKGREIHGFVLKNGFYLKSSIANSLVDMYACCGALEKSYNVFNCIEDKDIVLWTSMINAYGIHGLGKEAIDLFGRAEAEKVLPDHVTFLALLNACSHSSLVDEGKEIFKLMRFRYNLEPWPEHYACLVDLLGRSNNLEDAFQCVNNMEMKPTAAVWSALLGACRIHSNKELAEIAAQKLLELDPNNPGNYVLISNVYAATGRWEDVEEVRMRMRIRGLKKDPACSWIEIGNKVHTFMARDKIHPQSDAIYEKLAQITKKLEREGGYVAQTEYVLHKLEEKEKVQVLYGHSERLAMAYGLLSTSGGTPIRVTKNLRICGDCHEFSKLVSKLFGRVIIVRDAKRFHHFDGGVCSCGDVW